MSDRTLEVHCRNCGERFVAWYGEEEDAGTEVKDVEVEATTVDLDEPTGEELPLND